MRAAWVVTGVLLLAGRPAPAMAQVLPDTVDSALTVSAASGAPVIIGADTVLRILVRSGAFTSEERAQAITRRLERLIADPFLRADSVRIDPGEHGSDIVVGDVVVLTVTEADAAAAGLTRPELARSLALSVRAALRAASEENRLRTVLVGALLALLTAAAAVLAFRLVQRIFARAFAAAELGRETWSKPLAIQKLVLIPAGRIADTVLGLLRMARFLVLAFLLYIAIPLILSFFPWTRGYARRLFGYILTPFAKLWWGAVEFVPDLFTIGAIIVVTWYMLKLIRAVFVGIARGNLRFTGFYPEWAIPTYKLVRTLLIVFAFAMIWPYLPGSESPAFQGVGVMLGLLVSFGSASAVSNVIGGVVLTYTRSFRPGDRVRIADTEGDVLGRDLLVTRVRTTKNVEITIPNSMVLSSHIINYSSNTAGVALHTRVSIGYEVPWRRVHELLVAAAAATPGIMAEPAPFVLQISLDDFYITYELNAYTSEPGRMNVLYSELHANILDAFGRADVEILSPHYRANREGPPVISRP